MAKKKNPKALLVKSLLDRITDFELQTSDNHFLDWCEELRDILIAHETDELITNFPHCKECGCTEMLCGHNKREGKNNE